MKTTIFLSFFLTFFFPIFLTAQLGQTHPGNAAGVGNLANLEPLSAPAITFDNRYQGVQGSPYFWNDFRTSELIINKKDTLNGVQTRLQLVEPYVEVMVNGRVQGQLSFSTLNTMRVNNPDGTLGVYVTKTIDDKVELMEVLHDGHVKLYQRLRKRMMKADYEGAHSVDKRFDEYVNLFSYYLEDATGNLHKVKLRAKAFTNVMPADKTQIQKYFKQNIIKEPKDVLPLLNEIDKQYSKK